MNSQSAEDARIDRFMDLEEQICDLARGALAASLVVEKLIGDMSAHAKVLGKLDFARAYSLFHDEIELSGKLVSDVRELAKSLRVNYYGQADEVTA